MEQPKVMVVDFGSQYTQVIGRTLREIGLRSVIVSPQRVEDYLQAVETKALILSGGSASVYDENAPTMSTRILERGIPTLGICYGMQWIARNLGGQITAATEHKEYGEAKINISERDPIFQRLKGPTRVWASHGDSVEKVPPGFLVIASSLGQKTIAAMSNEDRKIWGLQFHPEVTQTDFGKDILERFLYGVCRCKSDWYPDNIAHNIADEVFDAIGDAKVIGGFSGGVDSSTIMKILQPRLKERLLAVLIDGGQLREGEIEEVKANAEAAGVQLRVIDAVNDFQSALSNTSDAQEKRKIFQGLYGYYLGKAADEFTARYLLQGTLAPDKIESGWFGKAALIKSHHNVGLKTHLEELHPLRELFKFEVRELARRSGLPESVSERQPFPGPGLFIRIVGQPVTPERLDTVRWADGEVTRIAKESGVYGEISQLIVALACLPTVGIKGDGRSYESSVIVRGVQTQDFMTVEGYQFPPEVRREISTAITKHKKIVRVWFDETNKPPATTEME